MGFAFKNRAIPIERREVRMNVETVLKKGQLYLILTKIKIVCLTLFVASAVLFWQGDVDYSSLGLLMTGMGLIVASGLALNSVIEKSYDAKMLRTQKRPMVTGALSVKEAMACIVGCLLSAGVLLLSQGHILMWILTMLNFVLYAFVYTMLKRVTTHNTWLGAIVGALPPLTIGIVADAFLWGVCSFLILFVWQMPHFYAISVLCREDYKRAGFKMLSGMKDGIKRCYRHNVVWVCLWGLISVLPYVLGLSGVMSLGCVQFMTGALLLYLWQSKPQGKDDERGARGLLLLAYLYLPLWFIIMIWDKLS